MGSAKLWKVGDLANSSWKAGGSSHNTSRRGRYTPLQSDREELLLSSGNVHPPVSQIWSEEGFFDRSEGISGGGAEFRRPHEEGHLAAVKFRQGGGGGGEMLWFYRGGGVINV